MNLARCASILAVVAVAVAAGVPGVAGAAASGADLLTRAKAARQEAEKNLADARKRWLDERKALAARLQREYDALAAAKADAERARDSFRRLKAASADLERTATTTDRRIRSLIRQAADAAGVEVETAGAVEATEQTIWQGLQRRLAEVEQDGRIRIATVPVIARNGDERDVPVVRLGRFAAYACGDTRETCGLLLEMADGGLLVAGPYLIGDRADALRAAAGGDLSRLPIDIAGTLRDRPPAEPRTAAIWLEAGGLFVYPILAAGALGLILILERLLYLLFTQTPPSLIENVLPRLERRDLDGAREVLGRSRAPTARVLLAGVESAGKSEDERSAAMELALLAEAPRMERSLSLIGALAGVAPLLGLLGTVSGMIATFDTISAAGTGNPRLLSGGISEALITTQLGLMVAIPLLLAHAGLRRWVERREAMLEHNAIQVFGVGGRVEGETQ